MSQLSRKRWGEESVTLSNVVTPRTVIRSARRGDFYTIPTQVCRNRKKRLYV